MVTETFDTPTADLDVEDSAGSSDSEADPSKQETRDFETSKSLSKLHLSSIEALQAKYIAFLEQRLKDLKNRTPYFHPHS